MILKPKAKSDWLTRGWAVDDALGLAASAERAACRQSFLQIPPFPGARVLAFEPVGAEEPDVPGLIDEIRLRRVGGTYWAGQPDVRPGRVLVRSRKALQCALGSFESADIVLWGERFSTQRDTDHQVISSPADPWHVLGDAKALLLDKDDDDLRLIAAIIGVACYVYDAGNDRLERCAGDAVVLATDKFPSANVGNPFTGEPMSLREAVELCGFWRRLIDSNRSLAAGLGFAFWKQQSIAPLLWDGERPIRFVRGAEEVEPEAEVAVWQSKVSRKAIARLQTKGATLIEVEDGFLRSRGLGANCIPPLSITVDRRGPHFDSLQPSDLEDLLESGPFDERVLARARELRSVIITQGLGKYEGGTAPVVRPTTQRRLILVPGQVEDDRAVLSGGCGLTSNLELLRRVRAQAPDAFILYKPHPDVVAGHRRGAISDRLCLAVADQVIAEGSIASIIAMVDEVHVNTSLTGFEALLRGKPVTTYGVPFYAGWGLTTDLGPVPARRTARRTIDELIAGALILYPRYLDPATGLPCPAEIVVRRLTADFTMVPAGMVVSARRLQGRLMRRLRSVGR